ncbi:MAG TPA: hypothetical protein VFC76_00305 [Oscillospiraceae bacterium]|nr:hypothetical protein [Oscillospiraceae bacterium]
MKYKEICNEQLNELSIELMNSGMPMHDVSCLTLDIYVVIKKHLEEESNEVN